MSSRPWSPRGRPAGAEIADLDRRAEELADFVPFAELLRRA